MAEIYCRPVALQPIPPIQNQYCSDTDSSCTETDSDCEEHSPFQIRTVNFCNSQQFEEDLVDFEEEEICEVEVCQPLMPAKKRKAYTSSIRNLGAKREYNKLAQKATSQSSIRKTLEKGCNCGNNCLAKFQAQELEADRRRVHSLKRHEKKQFFLENLRETYNKSQAKFVYIVRNMLVCGTAYSRYYQISKPYMVELRHMVRQNKFTVTPRPAKANSPDNSHTPQHMEFVSWARNWLKGRSNPQPDSHETHLAAGMHMYDFYEAYKEEMESESRQVVQKSTVYKYLAQSIPDVKKRQWVRFTKCSVCVKLEDRMEKAGHDQRRRGKSLSPN